MYNKGEVYEMLAQAENDVRNHRVAPIQLTFDELRKQLNSLGYNR